MAAASVEVIQLLIQKYPDAVKEKEGNNGRLPLYVALYNGDGAAKEVI